MSLIKCSFQRSVILLVVVAVVISCVSASASVGVKTKDGHKNINRKGISRDMKLNDFLDSSSTSSEEGKDDKLSTKTKSSSETEINKKVDNLTEDKNKKSGETTSSRYLVQLSNAFNSLGFSGTVITGIASVVLLPIFLVALVFILITPLHAITNPRHMKDEPEYGHGHGMLGYYKAPEAETYYNAPSNNYGGYAPAPAPVPTPAPVYGGYSSPVPSPTPSPQYGYGGYAPGPAPAPAPHPVPQPQYGYQEAPAPSPSTQYGYHSSPSSNSQTYSYPAEPSTSYGYQGGIVSAPSSHYASPKPQPPATSYGADSIKKGDTVKSSSSTRKTRSIVSKYNDSQCVERLACELSKAAKGIQMPKWMHTVADVLPFKNSNLLSQSRKLLMYSNNCSRFQCDSYDAWKQ